MKYILHIGRHKTGTSSLQHFLCSNREALERLGFYYPLSGLSPVAHHNVASRFLKRRVPPRFSDEITRLHEKSVVDLIVETARRSDTSVLSSEVFQNCDPKSVEGVFPATSTNIIVYLREQVDYIISSYQQKVHATSYYGSLADYSKSISIDYEEFLGRWEQAFGREQMNVRLYGKKFLTDEDIVSDFCSSVGIGSDEELVRSNVDRNPSIGSAVLEFKRLLNASLPNLRPHQRLLYDALSGVASQNTAWVGKPLLSLDESVAIQKMAQAPNRRVLKRYRVAGEGFGALPQAITSVPGKPIDRDAVIEVARRMSIDFPVESEIVESAVRQQAGRKISSGKIDWSSFIDDAALAQNTYRQN